MKKLCRLASTFLSLALIMSVFSGCGRDGDGEDGLVFNDTGFVYVPSYKSVTLGDVSYIQASCFTGTEFYFIADVFVGEETRYYVATNSDLIAYDDGELQSYTYDVYEPRLFSLDIETGEASELAYRPSQAGDESGNTYINALICDHLGNLYILEETYTYTFDLPEDFDEDGDEKWDYFTGSEYLRSLISLDSRGETIATIDLGGLIGENEYIYGSMVASGGDGSIYLATSERVIAINGLGEMQFEIELDQESMWLQDIIVLGNGNAGIVVYGLSGDNWVNLFHEIDPETKTLGEGRETPYNAYNLMPGSGEYDLLWSNTTYLFGYELDKGESTRLLSWIGCDVDSSSMLSSPIMLEDGNILLVTGTYGDTGDSYKTELVTLVRTPANEVEQKKVLTLGCAYLDYYLRRNILEFNRQSEDYRIEVVNYSEFDTGSDPTAGITKLNTEIIAGSVPDIIYTNDLPISLYSSKGLLEDLLPFIEADAGLDGMDALLEPVINTMKTGDGQLHYVAGSFRIVTAVGSEELIGDKRGWNFDEFFEVYSRMPDGADIFDYYFSRDEILMYINAMCLDGLIDWETGECYFDTDNFKGLLEFASMFPEVYEWSDDLVYEGEYTRISEGKQMLQIADIYSVEDIQRYNLLFGGAVFPGFPTESRDGSAFYIESGLAISTACSDKDAAWQFVRNMLTKEYQEKYTWSLPTNREYFDELIEKAMKVTYYCDEITGEQVEEPHGSVWTSYESIPFYALTEEELDQLSSLIENTTRLFTYDESIFEIINDAAAPYFSGQRSLDDTAAQIQSRVNLYVNEQR